MKYLNILLAWVFLCSTLLLACSDSDIEPDLQEFSDKQNNTKSSNHELKIMSWNVKLLNTPISSFPNPFQPQRICSFIEDLVINDMGFEPDIVAFQEVFESGGSETLINCMNALGYNVVSGNPINHDPITGPEHCLDVISKGSGLLTFSKVALISEVFEEYNDCNGCGTNADCFADKGFLVSEYSFSSGPNVKIINTHTDAGGLPGDRMARFKQTQQLGEWTQNGGTNFDANFKLVAMGDFNTESLTEINSYLVDNCNMTSLNTTITTQTCYNCVKVLDHILTADDAITPNSIVDFEVISSVHQNAEPNAFCNWQYEFTYPGSSETEIFQWQTYAQVPGYWRPYVQYICEPMNNFSDHLPLIATLSY